MKKVKELVLELLKEFPKSRDCDFYLCTRFWTIKENAIYSKFLDNFEYGLHTNPATIIRARRKLQLIHHELRGLKYEKRMLHQKKVKKELGYKV